MYILYANASQSLHLQFFVCPHREQVTQYRSLSKDKRELEAQLEAVSSTSPSRSVIKRLLFILKSTLIGGLLHSQSEGKSSASTPAADKARKNKMKKVILHVHVCT